MNIIIAILLLAAYTLLLIRKKGKIPSSLSASVFSLPANRIWIWTAVIFAVCILCVPTYIDKTGENTQFLAFIAIAALAFVGAAPLVKDRQDLAYKVHCVSAGICALCSQVVLAYNMPLLLSFWMPFITYGVRTGWIWRTKVFWGEIVCFISTLTYCLMP